MKRRALLALLVSLLAIGRVRLVAAQSDTPKFKPAELDQMLAPIALYPDSLLSQILMASGYPLEIVEAARWLAGQSQRQGRCRGQGRRRQELGRQREVAGRLPARPDAAQRASRLDAEARRCADRTAAGCRRLDPAPARQGGGGRQPEERQGADRHHPNPGQRDRSTPFSRPIPKSSMCRATIPTPPMASGPTRAIRRPTIRRPAARCSGA